MPRQYTRTGRHLLHVAPTEPSCARRLQVQIRPAGNIAAQGYKTNAQSQTVQRTFGGQGADSDIVVASTRAYVAALNKMIAHLSAAAPAPVAEEESVDEAGEPAAVA